MVKLSASALLAASLAPASQGRRTAFLHCSADAGAVNDIGPVDKPPPACLTSGEACNAPIESRDLKLYARAVDRSFAVPLLKLKQARQAFERQACSYRFAEIQEKGQQIVDSYGPDGPSTNHGSYLHYLRKWKRAMEQMHQKCASNSQCMSITWFLKSHPEADDGAMGEHGRGGSAIFDEFRKACEVGKSRSPVPNDSPVWCDETTGLCSYRRCREWWQGINPEIAVPAPWVDDRNEYDQLLEACDWVEQKTPDLDSIKAMQRQLSAKADELKIQYCKPAWVDGYCGAKQDQGSLEPCILENGQQCQAGKVVPHSDDDVTAAWNEFFQEEPVSVSIISPLFAFRPCVKQQGKKRMRGFL